MLFWFHEFSLNKILPDPLSYTQLIATLLKLELSGMNNKVREWHLAQKQHVQNNWNVFLKGVICVCKCATVEYTDRSFQESIINLGPLGHRAKKVIYQVEDGHKFKHKKHFHWNFLLSFSTSASAMFRMLSSRQSSTDEQSKGSYIVLVVMKLTFHNVNLLG